MRLSENTNYSVLLLEAGPDDNKIEIHVPGASTLLQRNEIDWQYKTTPQPHTANRVHNWPRGRVLGGCSSTNFMIAVRGHKNDYERWEKEHGCTGWGWNDVLPYFKKLEDYKSGGSSELRGVGGPVPVTKLSEYTNITHRFIKASVAAGLKYLDDYNGEESEGLLFLKITLLFICLLLLFVRSLFVCLLFYLVVFFCLLIHLFIYYCDTHLLL